MEKRFPDLWRSVTASLWDQREAQVPDAGVQNRKSGPGLQMHIRQMFWGTAWLAVFTTQANWEYQSKSWLACSSYPVAGEGMGITGGVLSLKKTWEVLLDTSTRRSHEYFKRNTTDHISSSFSWKPSPGLCFLVNAPSLTQSLKQWSWESPDLLHFSHSLPSSHQIIPMKLLFNIS